MQAAWRNIIVVVIALAALVFIVAPSALAVVGIDEPIIPCGTEITTDASGTHIVNPCTFCHFFALIQNVYNFLIFIIVPPVAVLMVAIGGFFWLTAGGSASRVQKGWGVLKTVGIGLLMVYVSWLVVSFGINLIAKDIVKYNPAVWYDPTSWFKVGCLLSPLPPSP